MKRSTNHRSIERSFPLDIKSLNEDGTFEGYLAVFGNEDLGGDVIVKGAFSKTLAENNEFPLLWMHDMLEPVGTFTAEQNDVGLYIRGKLTLDDAVPCALKVYALMKSRAIKGLSVGMNVIKHMWQGSVRRVTEVMLLEGSLTPIPMNQLAQIVSVKSDGNPINLNARFIDAMKTFIPTVAEEIDPELDYWMNMAKMMQQREMDAMRSFRYSIHDALSSVTDEVLLYSGADTLTDDAKRDIFANALRLHGRYMTTWFEEMLSRLSPDADPEQKTLHEYTTALHATEPSSTLDTPSRQEPQPRSATPSLQWGHLQAEMKSILAQRR